MSYTFGAGTGDDITVGASHAGGANGGAALVAGWWYPTTLTNGRGYCSFGQTYGMYVDATTSTLRFKTDNTTDGELTAPAVITVNKWWFIAFLSVQDNSGPTSTFRCWAGDIHNIDEITVTSAVAPVGNFTGNANRTAGNIGTGTVAFQGDVGWMSTITHNQTTANSPLGLAAFGSISNAEADLNLNKWVRPLWLGRPNMAFTTWGVPVSSATFSILHMPLNIGGVAYEYSHDAPATPSVKALTINGATWTSNSPPRAPPENWPLQLSPVHRAA